MNVLLCILLIGAFIFLFSILCAFGLQAARAAFPTHQIPLTTISYQIDHQHGDMEQYVAKATSAKSDPQQQILVMNVTNGRVAVRACENPDTQVGKSAPEP
jgi:hypothetical protein